MKLAGGGNLIEGNLVGTDPTGPARFRIPPASTSAAHGGNTIGGTAAGTGNLVSGNTGYGIGTEQACGFNLIEGNTIGTNLAGTAPLGSQPVGIQIETNANTIGGTSAGAGNLISGNDGTGLEIITGFIAADDNLVVGNTIGTNWSGTAAVANTGSGVLVSAASGTTIGGTASRRG